jgi:hypothetical protein
MISNVIRLLHYLIVFFFFFGFLLPDKYVSYYLLFVIIIKLHWLTNNNECVLTQLEQYYDQDKKVDMRTDTRYPFINSMANPIGIYLSDDQYDYIFNVIVSILFLYGIYKYRRYLLGVNGN